MSNRNHRRRFVVAALAALSLALVYCRYSRPNIDPRLIGRWTVHHPLDKSWPRPMVEFRPDGTATWWSADIPQRREYAPRSMRWSATGDKFTWRFVNTSLLMAIQRQADRLRYRWFGANGVAPHERQHQIVEVSADEITIDHIRPDNSTDRFTFRREE